MKMKHIAIAFLAGLSASQVLAQSGDPQSQQNQPSMAPSSVATVTQNQSPVVPTSVAQQSNNMIQGTSAGGQTQTTVVDQGGNLKMMDSGAGATQSVQPSGTIMQPSPGSTATSPGMTTTAPNPTPAAQAKQWSSVKSLYPEQQQKGIPMPATPPGAQTGPQSLPQTLPGGYQLQQTYPLPNTATPSPSGEQQAAPATPSGTAGTAPMKNNANAPTGQN